MSREKKSKKLKMIVVVEVIAILCVINLAMVFYLDKACEFQVENQKIESQRKITSTSLKTGKNETEEQKEKQEERAALVKAAKKAASSMEDEVKILVNQNHKVPKKYEVTLVTYQNTNKQVAEVIYEPLKSMLTDGKGEGLSFQICSAYRSNEY